MTQKRIPASFFGMVLGLSGLGQAWRIAAQLWQLPHLIGESLLLLAGLVWAVLLLGYIWQVMRHFDLIRAEFLHPVQGGTPALLVFPPY